MLRRHLVTGALASGALAPWVGGCSSTDSVERAAGDLRRVRVETSQHDEVQRELVRFATLAPSSHNTQCWTFSLQPRSITIGPDLSRRCPVVDPDDHHLFVSLGCAAENLVQAAQAYGLSPDVRFDAANGGSIVIGLEAAAPQASPLFQAIAQRQCSRSDYDGQPLQMGELRLLERAGNGDGVHVMFLTQRMAMEKVLEYVVEGNTAQMNDPAFIAELLRWIRFGAAEAVGSGDGLFTGASGNPVLPRWLGSRLMGLAFTPSSENERYARQVRNAAGIAVFVAERSDKAHWVEAGRCYERFALQATALGIRNAFLNQPVEEGSVRPQFASWLGIGDRRPDLVVRFGRGPVLPMSLRRPVQAVLV